MSRKINCVSFHFLCELDSLNLLYDVKTISRSKCAVLNDSNLKLRVIAGNGEHFVVKKSFFNQLNTFFIYIWDVLDDPKFFILSIEDIKNVCGPFVFKTNFWKRNGTYHWSSATGLPKMRRKIMYDNFYEVWNRLFDF